MKKRPRLVHFLKKKYFEDETGSLSFVHLRNAVSGQCDQIGRFIGLWATFQSIWQQLICPNIPYSQAIFVKVSKSLIFLVESILGNFWRLFTGHTVSGGFQHMHMHNIQPKYNKMNQNIGHSIVVSMGIYLALGWDQFGSVSKHQTIKQSILHKYLRTCEAILKTF